METATWAFLLHVICRIPMRTHTPDWLTELDLQIYVLETCATLLAIKIIAQLTTNATIILFVDNTGTQNAMISGTPNNQVANQTVATFWQVASRNNISVWVERVDPPQTLMMLRAGNAARAIL